MRGPPRPTPLQLRHVRVRKREIPRAANGLERRSGDSREPGLEVTAGLLAALGTTPVAVGAVGARGTVRATLAGSTLARASGTDLLLECRGDDLQKADGFGVNPLALLQASKTVGSARMSNAPQPGC